MRSLYRMLESIIIMSHQNKVLFPGKVLLPCLVLMQALCLSRLMVVSRGCRLLLFAKSLRFWALDETLVWRETLLKTHPRRRRMWQVSVKKRFVVRSAGVDDSVGGCLDDCDEAGNVITRDGVCASRTPEFLAFVADGKPLNMHGCAEAAHRSVVRVTELTGLSKQQGATVPEIVNTFWADSQDQLVLFAFCLANMALKRK